MPSIANPTELRNWCIYKVTNPKGRIYIGLTSDVQRRVKNYSNSECRNQKLLYNSIIKYGWGSHEFCVIDSFESDINYAYGKEMFWVKSYMSSPRWGQNGMNANDGGSGNIGNIHSEETKRKISIGHIGKVVSAESRRKMSESKKGINTYWPTEETIKKMSEVRKGFKLSEETKRKISETRKERNIPSWRKGKKMSEDEKQYLFKPVSAFALSGEFIKEFKSIDDAVIGMGVSEGTVQNSLNGRVKKPTKFIFKYK